MCEYEVMEDVCTPADIEVLARQSSLSMAEVCRRAGVAQSTFTRWKAGKTEPTLDAYRRLRLAVVPEPAMTPRYADPLPPMPEAPAATQALGMHEPQVRYIPSPLSNAAEPSAAEAAQIYARINRELATEEARADRLMRLYNL